MSDEAKEWPGSNLNRIVKLDGYLSIHTAELQEPDNKPLFDNPKVRKMQVFSFGKGLIASLQNVKIKIHADALGKLPMLLEKLWHHTNTNTHFTGQ